MLTATTTTTTTTTHYVRYARFFLFVRQGCRRGTSWYVTDIYVLLLLLLLTHARTRRHQLQGMQYGFRGFYDKDAPPVVLTRSSVEGIHLEGGTILGTSRGGADMAKIVRQIDIMGIDMVFVVGGNGTYRCCCGSRRRNYVSLSHAQTTTTTDNDRHDRHDDDSQAATRARRPSSRRARRTTCCAPWWAFRSRSTTIFC